jgi:hypothetical protein
VSTTTGEVYSESNASDSGWGYFLITNISYSRIARLLQLSALSELRLYEDEKGIQVKKESRPSDKCSIDDESLTNDTVMKV